MYNLIGKNMVAIEDVKIGLRIARNSEDTKADALILQARISHQIIKGHKGW
ncbi:MAG: hypothetical protein QME48_08540 [bacterium]|uniref:Uncharacterized protein n=1 Tax=candidate division TA06 bacterium 34_109 TaxID=1635277 RepID=A0A101I0L1_UNCT6|nr:MAG: hypothetical protein XD76_0396 [candidate division TA06 bacterium 32_111]KUK86581.1 MAG: hypothetical protein XE03_1370 [candidate division TA06 bacterium 34_109]MDI6701256.1 hypothetical protein [bacterium]